MSNEDIALIEAYLNGSLSDAQAQAFEQRMQSDAAFADAVALHQDIQASVKAKGRAELKSTLAGIEATLVQKGQIKDYTPPKGGSVGGIVLTIVVGGLMAFGTWAYLTDAWKGWLGVDENPPRFETVVPAEADTLPAVELPTLTPPASDSLEAIPSPILEELERDSAAKTETHPNEEVQANDRFSQIGESAFTNRNGDTIFYDKNVIGSEAEDAIIIDERDAVDQEEQY